MGDEVISEFLSLDAAARRYGIPRNSIERATAAELPKIKINERVIRVRASDVSAWLARKAVL